MDFEYHDDPSAEREGREATEDDAKYVWRIVLFFAIAALVFIALNYLTGADLLPFPPAPPP